MIEQALRGVAGRHRELELRLESGAVDGVVHDAGAVPAGARPGRAVRGPRGPNGRGVRAAPARGHPAVPARAACGRGRGAASSARVSDAQLVAAIGPDSAWLTLAIGQLFKTDRLDAAAPHGGDRARRGAAARVRARVRRRRRRGAHGSRCEQERPPRPRLMLVRPTRLRPARRWQHVDRLVLPDRRARRARRARRGAGGARRMRRRGRDRRRARCSRRARTCARAQGDLDGALADQLEARRLQATGTAPDPDFDGWLRIARLLHATGDDQASAAREAESALELGAHLGHAGLPRAGAHRLRADPRRRRGPRTTAGGGRAARALAGAPRARPLADRARRRAAPPRRAQGRARAAAPCARPRRGGRAGRDRRAGTGGAAGDGSQGPPPRVVGP